MVFLPSFHQKIFAWNSAAYSKFTPFSYSENERKERKGWEKERERKKSWKEKRRVKYLSFYAPDLLYTFYTFASSVPHQNNSKTITSRNKINTQPNYYIMLFLVSFNTICCSSKLPCNTTFTISALTCRHLLKRCYFMFLFLLWFFLFFN